MANVCTTFLSGMARLKRVLAIDLSRYPHCGAELQVIGAITDASVIARLREAWEPRSLEGRGQPRAPPSPVTN